MHKASDPFYNSAAWRTKRRQILKRDNNTCQQCGFKTDNTRHLQVDHIYERKDYPQFTFNDANLRTLCRPCHTLKTFGHKTDKVVRVGSDGFPINGGW